MELLFSTPDLQAIASSESGLKKIFGAQARRAAQRLSELAASENLGTVATLPTLELTHHDGDILYSVYVSLAYRIFFEIVQPASANRTQPTDITTISTIRIAYLGEKL